MSNLYPFTETVASGASDDECVEQIDIGGPAMVRAAAKNHPSVAVVTSPSAYPRVIAAVSGGGFTLARAPRAGRRGVRATSPSTTWRSPRGSPKASAAARAASGRSFAGTALRRTATLRYGENPHQTAALYTDPAAAPGLAQAEQLGGKEMSYNNYVDADAAWRAAQRLQREPCVAIIKHANPCGIAVGADVAEAHRKAHACDPVSAYGGVIAVNRPVTVDLAEQIAEIFTEVVVAPAYEDGAARGAHREEEPAGAGRAPAWTPARRPSAGRSPAACWCRSADRIDAPGDDPSQLALAAGARPSPGRARRPRVRLAGGAVGEVQRDPAGPRRRDGRRRAWARSTGSTRPASR